MKWLSDFIKTDMPIKDFCHGMTMSGSKVEGYEAEGKDISGVVVGKILDVVPHPDSDHLLVCQVDVAKEDPIQIVTGASNVKTGDLVPVALSGAVLPTLDKPITKGKLRGVESSGMLCSLGELGLTVNDFPYAVADGIFIIQEICEVGQDIHMAIGLNDTAVEFEITSNRPDCLSVIGLAREASATFAALMNVPKPEFEGVDGNISDMLSVDVQNTQHCKRYCAGIVKNARIQPSPRWMRERLRTSGVRPINNFVDITNYVMLEYGQPMHAFDLRYVEDNKITVRNAAPGEKIVTLDGEERTLDGDMLVIADSRKPVAVAGVMGGEYSGIMDDTTTIVFESAYFEPRQVRRTAKKLGMRSESSSRFEKGADPKITKTALKRALQLVEEICAGDVVKTVIDKDFTDKAPNAVCFNPDWINSFLGTQIPETDMYLYLKSLGFKANEGFAYPPSFRVDIEGKADIAEEVARIYGYGNIPVRKLSGVAEAELTPQQRFTKKLNETMVSLGCYGISTYSFVSPKGFDRINLPADSKLRHATVISNPLGEDTSIMRTTAVPSVLEVLSFNYNNRNETVKVFEIGTEYIPTEEGKIPNEPKRLSFGMYGGVDFYDIKGIADVMLCNMNICGVEYVRAEDSDAFDEKSAFHPGRSAVILKDGVALGIIGEIHPTVLENYGIGTKAYVAKFNIPEMMDAAETVITYKPLPKFPASTRDLALICNDATPVANLEKVIKSAAGKLLEKVRLFDVYSGSQIEEGKKSVAYSLTLRSGEGTLTDKDADRIMKNVLEALSAVGAEIRK